MIRVTATDPDDPVEAVTLYFWPGGANVASTPMVKQSGTNFWQATINAQNSWQAGQINYWVQAVDSNGNQSGVLDHSNNYILNKGDCFL